MRFRFPIRFKILLTLLLVSSTVVGVITFTMAQLFHTDKTAYIHDLTSVIALHTAEEADALLRGYAERLEFFTRIMPDAELSEDKKTLLVQQMFESFPEFLAVTLQQPGAEEISVYDAQGLAERGVMLPDLNRYRAAHPLPLDSILKGQAYVENATLREKLPMLIFATAVTMPDGQKQVASAVIRLDSLLNLAKRSTAFETLLVDGRGRVLAHTDLKQVTQRATASWILRLRGLREQQSLGATLEYQQKGVDMVGGFARVSNGGLLVCVQIPKAAAYLTARELLQSLMGVALVLLLISALVGILGSGLITRPMQRLSEAAQVVATGQFDVQVKVRGHDEMADLAGTFNQMTTELKTREAALQNAQAALVQSEKMAAFGQLGAGIAHEIKNPLAGILGYAQLAMRKVEQDNPLRKQLEVIVKETRRCKDIIDNLMRFARQEKATQELTDINKVVLDACAIVDHQLGIHQVKLERYLGENLPNIMGNGNQLQQVLMNLLINAQQAMGGAPGTVRLRTALLQDGRIQVRVTDSGPGIPPEIQAKIFEPFFTTKPAGQGTGLGLSVSFGIIRDHQGEIRVESEVGKGTTFIITLPGAQEQAAG